MNSRILLKITGLSKAFGFLNAVQNVHLELLEGKVYSIIGPNGAGKTTLFNLISGHLEPTTGLIQFRNRVLNGLKPFQICKIGVGRSFQINNFFPGLTVLENVRLALQARHPARFNMFRRVQSYREINENSRAILEKIGLLPSSSKLAQFLSHGDKRLLEIGIALATKPTLLLLDEPTCGLAPEETAKMIDFIRKLSQELTITFIEHKINMVMTISDQVIVMHQGAIISQGSPRTVQEDPEVKRAYLGA